MISSVAFASRFPSSPLKVSKIMISKDSLILFCRAEECGHLQRPEWHERNPRAYRKHTAFDLTQGEPFGTSDLQRYKIIILSCFKLLNVCSLITAAIGNGYILPSYSSLSVFREWVFMT